MIPRKHSYRMHNFLAEVIMGLKVLSSLVMSALIAVSKPQAHPVLELVLDTIEQVTEVAADIAHHRELLCRCGEHSSLHRPAEVCGLELQGNCSAPNRRASRPQNLAIVGDVGADCGE